MNDRTKGLAAALLVSAACVIITACTTANAPAGGTVSAVPAGSIPQRTKEQNTELGRQHKTAAELGLTARAIRYYEELRLLAPAARSEGAYRLYDPDDVERLRFIKGLRDDAGFSLTEIGQLLEDEAMRARNRDRFRTTNDATERRNVSWSSVKRSRMPRSYAPQGDERTA